MRVPDELYGLRQVASQDAFDTSHDYNRGIPGRRGKVHRQTVTETASYAVSHHTLRVQRMTSIQPKWLTNILVCIPSSFKCILRREFHLLRGSSLMRECRAPRKLLSRIQCLQEENFQPPASDALYFRAFLKMQEKLN